MFKVKKNVIYKYVIGKITDNYVKDTLLDVYVFEDQHPNIVHEDWKFLVINYSTIQYNLKAVQVKKTQGETILKYNLSGNVSGFCKDIYWNLGHKYF